MQPCSYRHLMIGYNSNVTFLILDALCYGLSVGIEQVSLLERYYIYSVLGIST